MSHTVTIAPAQLSFSVNAGETILEAALEVFSAYGFRGATLDQIAEVAGLSKPNLLYYFASKEAMHQALLTRLLDTWLDPLRNLRADGDPLQEILGYVRHKVELSRDYPRESRLFANEILQGAPRMMAALEGPLKTLVDEKAAVLLRWMAEGRIALLAFGAVLPAAEKVAAELGLTVVNMRFVKPLDRALVLELARSHDAIVTLEDNAIMGGAGSGVAELLAAEGITLPVLHLGLPDRYQEHASREQLLSEAGLDAEGIRAALLARWPDLAAATPRAQNG